jgi:hypothetical protein
MAVAILGLIVFMVLNRSVSRRSHESIQCINNMVALGLAARMWANGNGDHLPASFSVMSNEMATPRILRCPSDQTRPLLTRWSEFTPELSTYEIVSPGMPESDTHTAYLRCQIHGHLAYADATVFDGVERRGKRR